jgi:nucleoside-diphosphate-sugar epimerase
MTEAHKSEPWTLLAKYKLAVEQELPNIPDLDYVIVRPAIVYGPGDRTGLSELS